MPHQCEKVGMEFFDHARYRFRAHEIIAAAPERIFEVFLDGPSWTRWATPITAVDWTSPFPLEVGATRTVTMRGGLVGLEEFIAWDPPRRMAFRFNEVSRPGVDAFAEDYRVTDLGDGRSLVEWTMVMTPSGPGARAFPLTAPLVGAGVRHMLANLRRYVESGPTLAPLRSGGGRGRSGDG